MGGASSCSALAASNSLTMAGLIDELDLVITVDTVTGHIAGALDRPVWILLPVNCDWRWHAARDHSPWYPSARLFRQERADGWPKVVQQVAAELNALARGEASIPAGHSTSI